MSAPLHGVGLGWRRELASTLLGAPGSVRFVEVVAESCFADPRAYREAQALAEIWPVVPHGVKLSLASGDGLDVERARRLGALAKAVGAPAVSEHVALTRGGGREIGHLTSVPFTRETVSAVARNVDALRRHLQGVPLLLENIAWTFRYPEDEMDEGTFHAEIAEATGCDLLLDLANLYANAVNSGTPPEALLERYPLERVGMVHVAGGVLEDDGFYVDTHAHAVPAPVHALLERLTARVGAVPVLLERDDRFPPGDELAREIAALEALLANAPRRSSDRRAPGIRPTASASSGAREAEIARLLTEPTLPEDTRGLDRTALVRTRRILQHKRVDEALPLLPRLAAHGDAARTIAFRALAGTPRPLRFAGFADALAIAKLAARASDGRLAGDAAEDALELSARVTPAGRPRWGPGLAARRLPSGGAALAWKGPGGSSKVHTLELRPFRATPSGSFPGKEVS
ncbi:MAG: DUF692 domain-containing protein [Acidobacteria bacterium]|nr:DUF692 domain-containing protein [Acidobacteriota bacterium]